MTTGHLRLVRDDDIVAKAPSLLRCDAWLAPPVRAAVGTLAEVFAYLPHFERRPFRVTTGLIALSADHPRWDVIVRIPNDATFSDVPVGVVSKTYALVQHRDVLQAVARALVVNRIDAAALECELLLSPYAERMQLTVRLPAAFDFDPGDGAPIGLTLHVANSVDGTTRLSILLGWFRYICSNGLIVGTTAARARYVHRTGIRLESFDRELSTALKQAASEQRVLRQWTRTSVPLEAVARWADGPLTRKWGVKAATRAYHIFQSGNDIRFTHPFETAPASQRQVKPVRAVPGAFGDTLYTASQVLAWLARERADHEQRLNLLLQIPALIRSLRGPR